MGPGKEPLGPSPPKGSQEAVSGPPSTMNTPVLFRLATANQLNNEPIEDSEACTDSTYGVKSLQDSVYDPPKGSPGIASQEYKSEEESGMERRRSTLKPPAEIKSSVEGALQGELTQAAKSPALPLSGQSRPPSISHSITSVSLDSQAPLSSFPSSPKTHSHRSFRPSDEESMDETGSQPMLSSSEDEARPPAEVQDSDSALQLVMPSIRMPSRRPFTDRGKALRRLKVLLAGDSGTFVPGYNS